EEKLAVLESQEGPQPSSQHAAKVSKASSSNKQKNEETSMQLSMFTPENSADWALIQRIKNLDLMEVTPSKAIAILEELQQAARERK
ncbi:MAG: hypothetical protein HUJ80_00345, partial [Firmicutes bacterium]|nr:hypothetical protein [Bacillota bacterium]